MFTDLIFLSSFYFTCRLGESISANNSYRQQEVDHVSKRSRMQASMTGVNSMKSSIVCPSNDDASTFNIQDLIQKLQSGLEVNTVVLTYNLSYKQHLCCGLYKMQQSMFQDLTF